MKRARTEAFGAHVVEAGTDMDEVRPAAEVAASADPAVAALITGANPSPAAFANLIDHLDVGSST
ncbi:hypothetical protein AB0I53_40250 [Saccharopolyspora sp. NPDC050389]|uniref:hypothetical protein n=1 Tax=Saccharopolyspora sp. NPDC050389 TaxID=3155516 RepID=UPI0033C303B0